MKWFKPIMLLLLGIAVFSVGSFSSSPVIVKTDQLKVCPVEKETPLAVEFNCLKNVEISSDLQKFSYSYTIKTIAGNSKEVSKPTPTDHDIGLPSYFSYDFTAIPSYIKELPYSILKLKEYHNKVLEPYNCYKYRC